MVIDCYADPYNSRVLVFVSSILPLNDDRVSKAALIVAVNVAWVLAELDMM